MNVPPPRIAINGRFLTQITAGVQRFAIETIKAIDGLLDTPPYAALRGRVEIVAPPNARDFNLTNIPLRRTYFLDGYGWEQIEFPIFTTGRLRLNLCMLGPIAVRNQAVVIHDASIRALPKNFSPRFRAAYGFLIPRLCQRATLSVTVSEFSRQEIAKWYGVNTEAMPICGEGCDHITATPADISVVERLDLKGRQFFLGVGVGSSNKNIDNVMTAFAEAKLDDTLLVLTGKRDLWVHGGQEQANAAGVHNVGFVSDAELRALYEHAIALVYPSRYEGFGLPPLEAMKCGCPVIISDQPALLEVAGNAALQCGVDDIIELTRLMRTLHSDPALREQLKVAGLERASHFTWRKTARKLLDHCLEVGA